MGKKLLLLMLFLLLTVLISGHYGIIPSPWIEEGVKTMETRDQFVNMTVKVLDADSK